MAKKNYTKEEIKELLKNNYNAVSVVQVESDYEDEYRVLFQDDDIFKTVFCEVVSTMTAITNEEDFEVDKNKFLKDVIETLLNEEELIQIGAYNKLAEDLFWREY